MAAEIAPPLQHVNKLLLCDLYQHFTDRKQTEYLEKHGFRAANLENCPFYNPEDFLALHRNGAMFLLTADKQFDDVDTKVFEEFLVANRAALQREKTGIMWMDEDGALRFSHYSFVEYFAASWLCENVSACEAARGVARALYEREFHGGVRRFLDWMLTEGCPLHRAVLSRDTLEFVRLMKKGADVNQKDAAGRTAVHVAIQKSYTRCNLLIREECDVNARDVLFNFTPLQYVNVCPDFSPVGLKGMEIVEDLLKAGAQRYRLTAFAHHPRKALSYAISNSYTETMKLILENGITKYDYIVSLYWAILLNKHPTIHIMLTLFSQLKPEMFAKNDFANKCPTQTQPEQMEKNCGPENPDRDVKLNSVANTSAKCSECPQFLENHKITRSRENLFSKQKPTPHKNGAERKEHTSMEKYFSSATNTDTKPLHVAAWEDNLERVERLLECGSTVDDADEDGFTPLHVAAQEGHLAVLQKLVSAGAKVNQRTEEGTTPLHLAVSNGHEECVVHLHKHAASINESEGEGFAALHIAIANEHVELVEILLKLGADVHSKTHSGLAPIHLAVLKRNVQCLLLLLQNGSDPEEVDYCGFSSLHIATAMNDMELVEMLLTAGSDPNSSSNRLALYTPLHLVAASDNERCARCLLQHGANLHTKNEKGDCPLLIAARHGNANVLNVFLENGADVNSINKCHKHNGVPVKCPLQSKGDQHCQCKWGDTALHCAALEGHMNVLKRLLHSGANVDARTNVGVTPLMNAAYYGHLTCLQCLLQSNADPNATDCDGFCALHYASKRGHNEIVDMLLDAGAIANARASQGKTPLIVATRYGHCECIKILLTRGADPNCADNHGSTSLLLAAECGHLSALKTLVAAGAELHSTDGDGDNSLLVSIWSNDVNCVTFLLENGAYEIPNIYGLTPLHCAALRGHLDVLECVAYSCGVNAKDNAGHTALFWASLHEHVGCVKLLLSKGADPNATNHRGRGPMHCCAEDSEMEKALVEAGGLKEAVTEERLDATYKCCDQHKNIFYYITR